MIGQISEDGKWAWNGTEWVPRPPTSNEFQAMKYQSGQVETPENDPMHNATQSPTQQSPVMIIQQPNSRTWGAAKIAVISVIALVIFVAAIVVLSGVLYVWANSLADEDNGSIEGTWYNPDDTITFYPNGTVVESTGIITHWEIVNGDLITTFSLDEEEVDLKWKYVVSESTNTDDTILFLALYEAENGTQTNVVDETSCIAYSDSIMGAEHQHFDDRRAIFPDWCNPVDD